jgi:MFS superfamily sulfate permease-like transporter
VTVLWLTPLFKNLPEAVLAALIISAVSHLFKVAEFTRYYAERRIEFWLGLATLAGVLTLDVLPGLIIGVIAMLLLVVYNASKPHVAVLGRAGDSSSTYGDVVRHPGYKPVSGLLVVRLDAPLFYANASLVRDRIKQLVGSSDPTPTAVVLDLGASDELDITRAEVLEQLVEELRQARVQLALVEVHKPVIGRARRTGLLDTLGEAMLFHTVDEAVAALTAP